MSGARRTGGPQAAAVDKDGTLLPNGRTGTDCRRAQARPAVSRGRDRARRGVPPPVRYGPFRHMADTLKTGMPCQTRTRQGQWRRPGRRPAGSAPGHLRARAGEAAWRSAASQARAPWRRGSLRGTGRPRRPPGRAAGTPSTACRRKTARACPGPRSPGHAWARPGIPGTAAQAAAGRDRVALQAGCGGRPDGVEEGRSPWTQCRPCPFSGRAGTPRLPCRPGQATSRGLPARAGPARVRGQCRRCAAPQTWWRTTAGRRGEAARPHAGRAPGSDMTVLQEGQIRGGSGRGAEDAAHHAPHALGEGRRWQDCQRARGLWAGCPAPPPRTGAAAVTAALCMTNRGRRLPGRGGHDRSGYGTVRGGGARSPAAADLPARARRHARGHVHGARYATPRPARPRAERTHALG